MRETPETNIKEQFAKYFVKKDWAVFKKFAEYYLKQAAKLQTTDIEESDTFSLLFRNVQKRLFIGIACELLLKSAYLKAGYIINKPKDNKIYRNVNYRIDTIPEDELRIGDTFSFNQLLDNFDEIIAVENSELFEKGFRIAKVFRNKEGHVALRWQRFDKENYTDIENALQLLYKSVFNRTLKYQISFEKDEPWEFEIEKYKMITRR